MANNEKIVRDFVAAWSRLDAAELASYFAKDATYHNMPLEPVSGRANIERYIAGFIAPWTETDWEIVTLVTDGDLVMAEHMDRTRAGEKSVDMPCMGVFEMVDGKIMAWRDYFDAAKYTAAMR